MARTKREATTEIPIDVSSIDRPAGDVTEEHIRTRAYYLSLERNGTQADPLHDWLRAERELVGDDSAEPWT